MSQAVGAYHSITADKEFQYLEMLRTKARHDEAQALSNARKQGAKAEREHWQGVVAEKDEHWQGVVAEKDTTLAEQAKLIAELQAKLNKQIFMLKKLRKAPYRGYLCHFTGWGFLCVIKKLLTQ